MEYRDIKSFIEVADYKSFTKAAEQSYHSQPSLSKAVKKLEVELGVVLFRRSNRHVYLTDAGEIVYKQGKKALSALQELPILLDELKDAAAGVIKIGMPPLIGTLFFPQIARDLHTQSPNVEIELYELGAKVVEDLVESGEIDVGVIVLPTDDTLFNVHSFISDEFFVFVHQDHELAKQKDLSLHDLKDEKFILFSKGFALHNYIISACKEAGFNPTISYESSQWDLIIELVASKLGIALLPKSIFDKQNNEQIVMIPLKAPPLLWRLGIITKKDAYHSFALKKFMDMFS
ncbi:LysR family transcriptional regulator [Sporosarcina sp. BI001-red]|uniref:LysR family transcriptional regulator n=1 Tax=Sporosarcina sp. BI001-red TaxID=2282866 RepID=UPI000E22C025|nr:LysR family transcriptional regulator [Sporosarcina sp. BI001-red]REB05231.1 LysR family transcriptional regulator [Sporosarcina sp. BI001-red]